MSRGWVVFLVFFLSFSSCAAQQSGADFYEGLKKRHNGAPAEAVICFEKALNAANASVAAAAAAELMSLHFAGTELSTATMTAIRYKASGSWARAFEAVAEQDGVVDREKLLALLLQGDSRVMDEAAQYALSQWRNDAVDSRADSAVDNTASYSFTEAENAAIDGRIAASHSRYNEAMIFFRVALRDSPGLFFRYPDLLTDLGRSFQYAAAGGEGIDLFLKWERIFAGENAEEQEKSSLLESIPAGSENLVRFRLLFFAARMARQRGEKNIELFERALRFAPAVSPEQVDACIWYILDSSLAQSPGRAIPYLEMYSSQWHDDAYFSDVLNKLARELVFRRQWKNVYDVFAILQNHHGAAPVTAHYAWITGRIIEEGLFSPEKAAAETSAQVYMRIAYNAVNDAALGAVSAIPLYYRSLSAAALGAAFLVLPEEPPPVSSQKTAASKTGPAKTPPANNVSDVMQFLMGFLKNDAAQFASRYIRAAENDLSPEELRLLAEALGAAGRYQESMRLVSLYANRSGYQIKREDLQLLYPRPFREQVEQYAEETGIEPPLLFGLIRTESAFDPAIVSRAGAVGLSQLMPATAEEMAVRIHRRGGPDYIRGGIANTVTDIDLRNPAVNIHIGASYLAYLNERMEDMLMALLAYNGGMNRVRRWRMAASRFTGSSLPPDLFLETVEYPETRNYGRNVMGAAAMYKELYYKK